MIDFTQDEAISRLADLVAERVVSQVADRLVSAVERNLISRKELSTLTGLGVRTIDRMSKGGSWERDSLTRQRVWRPTAVKLSPIKQGDRILFDKVAALAAIKAGS